MPPVKGEEWKHVVIVDEKAAGQAKVKCVYCSKIFVGGAARIRNHLIGGVLSDISKCSEVPDGLVKILKDEVNQKEDVARKKRRNDELDAATRGPTAIPIGDKSTATGGGTGLSQTTVPGLFAAQKGGKEAADRAIARFFMQQAYHLMSQKTDISRKQSRLSLLAVQAIVRQEEKFSGRQ